MRVACKIIQASIQEIADGGALVLMQAGSRHRIETDETQIVALLHVGTHGLLVQIGAPGRGPRDIEPIVDIYAAPQLDDGPCWHRFAPEARDHNICYDTPILSV